MRMRSLIVAGLLAGLAACGGEPATQDAAQANDVANEIVAASHTPGEDDRAREGAAAMASRSDIGKSLDTSKASASTIPAGLQGRWGLVAADCTSTRGDAKGLIEVSGTQIRFYESRATLTNVAGQDETRIVGDFSFTGEGQTWERRMVLDGQDGGRTLIRREQGADAMPGMLRYRKCEAA